MVDVDVTLEAVNFSEVARTRRPDRDAVIEFSLAAFANGHGLILHDASHRDGVDNGSVVGRKVRVIGQAGVRSQSLIAGRADEACKHVAVSGGFDGSTNGSTVGILSNRSHAVAALEADRQLTSFSLGIGLEEGEFRAADYLVSTFELSDGQSESSVFRQGSFKNLALPQALGYHRSDHQCSGDTTLMPARP